MSIDESITASLPTNLEEPLLPLSEGGEPGVDSGSTTAAPPPQDTSAPPQDNTAPDNNNNNKNVTFSCCSKSYSINQNVLLTFILDALYGVSESLWAGTVFAAYLKRLGRNQNGPVGDIEAVNGLAVLCSALPVGYLADRYGRSIVIRAGGILFIITTVLHVGVMEWIARLPDDNDDTDNNMLPMILLGVIMGLWGIGGGVVSGPCQALYADSTPAGERSKYYQYLFVVYLLASCVGPIISIILFQSVAAVGEEDEWSMSTLRIIIYVGLGLEFLNATIMMFFDDSKALDEGDDEEEEEGETTPLNQLQVTVDEEGIFEDEIEHEVEGNNDDAQTVVAANTRLKKRQRWIPYILFVSSVVMSIGSGMTVKFFPLFFKDEVGMSPTQVQIVYVLVPVFMSLLSGAGTWIASSGFGRVQTSLLLQFAGIACLFCMVFCKTYLDSHPLVLVPVYVLRTALMNAPYPLQESILMDFVVKSERARWKSLESISQFGWCGSAALGGYLSDKWDYSVTFFVTALIQTVGTVVFALLLPLVPKQESQEDASGSSSAEHQQQQLQQQDVTTIEE